MTNRLRYVYRLEEESQGLGPFTVYCPVTVSYGWDNCHPTPEEDSLSYTKKHFCAVDNKDDFIHWFSKAFLYSLSVRQRELQATWAKKAEKYGRNWVIGVYRTRAYKKGTIQLVFLKEKAELIERVPVDTVDRLDYYDNLNR